MKSFIYTQILQTDSRLAYTHMHMDHVTHQHTHTPKHTHTHGVVCCSQSFQSACTFTGVYLINDNIMYQITHAILGERAV